MAKCKNCRNLYYAKVIFKHGTSTIPCCRLDDEDIEDIGEERECYEFECMSNADRIRSMTDEELASFWERECDEVIDCKKCKEPINEYGSCTGLCRHEFLRWLKSEVGCE